MKRIFRIQGQQVEVDVLEQKAQEVRFILKEKEYHFTLQGHFEERLALSGKEGQFLVWGQKGNEKMRLSLRGRDWEINSGTGRSINRGGDAPGSYESPMPGKIFRLLVKTGEQVKAGQSLIVLEAMKMEHAIKAHADGVVEKIFFPEGAMVEGGVELIKIKAVK